MAKKKRKTRKQKQQQTPAVKAAKPVSTQVAATEVPAVEAETVKVEVGQYGYVRREIRHILFITAAFVLLEVGLWLLFGRTSFETKLTGLINL